MEHNQQQKRKAHKDIEIHEFLLYIGKQIKDKVCEGNAYANLGVCYGALGQHVRAKEQYELYLNIAKEIGDKTSEGRAYGCLGECYRFLGQCEKAIEHLELCLTIAKQNGDKTVEGAAYGNLGLCYKSFSQFDKAIKHHEFRLHIAKQFGEKAAIGACYANLGICYRSLGQFDKAQELHELDLYNAKQIGDKTGEARAYCNLGNGYHILGQYDKAKEHFELSLIFAKQLGDKAIEGIAYSSLGNCYYSTSRYNEAKEHHELHLIISKQLGDKAGEMRAYGNLGTCYMSLGQIDKAIELHELNLRIAKQTGDKAGEVVAHINLGLCYQSLGQYDKAKEHHEIGLNIAKEIGDKAGQGRAHAHLGNLYLALGQYNRAKDLHELSLDISKQVGDKTFEEKAYANIGLCYYYLGQYDRAKEFHALRLNIAKQIGDKVSEGKCYGNTGACFYSLGNKATEGTAYANRGSFHHYLNQYDKSKEQHELCLSIAKQMGDKAAKGNALGYLGEYYMSVKQYDKAVKYIELHLNIAKQIGNKAGEKRAHDKLGHCYILLGLYDKAKEHYELQLNIAKQIGDKRNEANACDKLSACYLVLGQHDKCIEHLEVYLHISKQIGDKAGEAMAYRKLGLYYGLLKQWDHAECKLRSSLRCFQELFKNAPNEDSLKVSFRETFSATDSSLTRILLEQGKTDEALVFSEEGRSIVLTELMRKRYHLRCVEHQVLDLPQILEMVKAIGRTVLYFTLHPPMINVWIIKPNGDVKYKTRWIKASPQSMECYLTKNFCSHTEDLKSLINNGREMLKSHCTVRCEDRSLSFMFQEELTKTTKNEPNPILPFTTTSEGTSNVPEPGAPQDRHHSPEASQSRELSTTALSEQRRETEYLYEGPLKELYQILLAPVRPFVEGSQVVIVPDGALPLVPFAALMDENGRYVVESLQVRLVPSLATAKLIREYQHEPEGQASPLIVGDPLVGKFRDNLKVYEPERLPNANEEAQVIGQLLKIQPLTGEKATRQAVLDRLDSANLIHIAAHGDAERGEILFAPSPDVDRKNVKKEDVMLTISHLKQKHLRAKLVVLSCCNSGCGEIKTEGVIGIARAFLGAGARAVLVSIWAVDDKATLYFMMEFYKHLARGEKASEALSRAMKATREKGEFRNPYFWSPFVLVGDDVKPFGLS